MSEIHFASRAKLERQMNEARQLRSTTLGRGARFFLERLGNLAARGLILSRAWTLRAS